MRYFDFGPGLRDGGKNPSADAALTWPARRSEDLAAIALSS
jgi:hypothetical protein